MGLETYSIPFLDKSALIAGAAQVHYVIAEVDAGEPLVIKELDIDKEESCVQLEERMHRLEWLAIVEGTQLAIEKLRYEPTNIPLWAKSTVNPAICLAWSGDC